LLHQVIIPVFVPALIRAEVRCILEGAEELRREDLQVMTNDRPCLNGPRWPIGHLSLIGLEGEGKDLGRVT
jgi:hypothetical protein